MKIIINITSLIFSAVLDPPGSLVKITGSFFVLISYIIFFWYDLPEPSIPSKQ